MGIGHTRSRAGRARHAIGWVGLCLALAAPASAATRYVKAGNAGAATPFTNWTTAAATIQAALDVCVSNDLVIVTNGTYNTGGKLFGGGALTNRIVVPSNVTVRSVNGPAATRIVGAGPQGDGAVRCARLLPNSRLEGFTLTNGNVRITGGTIDQYGGAVLYEDPVATVPTISNCVLVGNNAFAGGALSRDCIVLDCVLANNTATDEGGAGRAGVYINCLIIGNRSEQGCAAVSAGSLQHCTVVSNVSAAAGGVGGLWNCTATNSIVWANSAPLTNNYTGGSLIYCCTTPSPGTPGTVTNNPAFVSLAGRDFHLTVDSPCLDAGCTSPIASDLEGRSRPYDGDWNGVARPDLGVYERRLPFATRYVSLAGGHSSPFTNWAGAATNFAAVMAVVEHGDTVLVTNGTYRTGQTVVHAALPTRAALTRKGLTVRSINGPAATAFVGVADPAATNGPGAVRCAYVGENCTLIGFTLTNGHTLATGASNDTTAGGAYCASNASLVDCVIVSCSARQAGGLYAGAGDRLKVRANWCADFGGGANASRLRNSVLYDNSADSGGGAAYCDLLHCTVVTNRARVGGGVYGGTLTNSIAQFNRATAAGQNHSNLLACAWSCTTPLPPGSPASFTNDPRFADLAARDLHLRTNSPCRDTASATAVTNDLDGVGRPQEGDRAWPVQSDMGALEGLPWHRTYYASLTGGNSSPYTNWSMAARSINAAIAKAAPGDMVLVGTGVYAAAMGHVVVHDPPDGVRNRVALTNGVTVMAFGGPSNTVLEGFSMTEASNTRCAYVGAGSALVGFRLTGGTTRRFGSARTGQSGAGAWCETNGILADCLIDGCFAESCGGGVFGGELHDCVLIDDQAGDSGGGACESRLFGCLLTNNFARYGGGAANGYASNCVVTLNQATFQGAGFLSMIARDCTLFGNDVDRVTDDGQGGGACGGELAGCLLVSNRADYGGGAYGARLTGCTVSGNSAEWDGGGCAAGVVSQSVLVANSSLLGAGGGCYGCNIAASTVVSNRAQAGGGCGGALTDKAEGCRIAGNLSYGSGGGAVGIALADCTVVGNWATNGMSRGGGVAGCAMQGGLLASNTAHFGGGASESTLSNVWVYRNHASIQSDFVTYSRGAGGGAYRSTLRDCVVQDNDAYREGGGGGVSEGSAFRCRIVDNACEGKPTASVGGAGAFNAYLENCLVLDNYALTRGGGTMGGTSVHCVVYDNWAEDRGGGMFQTVARSCIVWSNIVSPGWQGSNVYGGTVTYSCTTPLPGGAGNTSAPPLFVNELATNFHLLASSPCLDTAENGRATNDLDGVARPLDGDFDGIARADMGCYERLNPLADSDKDGLTDTNEWYVLHTSPAKLDTDDDGMDDAFEVTYTFDPRDAADGAGDADGDRMSNGGESVSGTHPRNSNSVLRLLSCQGAAVQWSSVTGRLYAVLCSTNLAGTNAWFSLTNDVPGRTQQVNVYTDRVNRARQPVVYSIGVRRP